MQKQPLSRRDPVFDRKTRRICGSGNRQEKFRSMENPERQAASTEIYTCPAAAYLCLQSVCSYRIVCHFCTYILQTDIQTEFALTSPRHFCFLESNELSSELFCFSAEVTVTTDNGALEKAEVM
jgi:hypothetical protein